MSARSFDINCLKKQANIKVSRTEQTIYVDLHKTTVFIYDNDMIQLNSGGWKTPTTKVAINRALSQLNINYAIVQKKGQWFVSCPDNTLIEFTDGMSISL